MSDTKDLRVGDVVRLNSSGHSMTVEALTDTTDGRKVHCVYFPVKAALQGIGADLIPIYEPNPCRVCVPEAALSVLEAFVLESDTPAAG